VKQARDDVDTEAENHCAEEIRDQGMAEDAVASGDESHRPALNEMKGRWKWSISGMGWYKKTKKEFAALGED